MGSQEMQHDNRGETAEFDSIAENYYEMHKLNTSSFGEDPDYFSEYKIADISNFTMKNEIPIEYILDFGCGIGNSIPYFRKYFTEALLTCADVSERSLEIAQMRFPGNENHLRI